MTTTSTIREEALAKIRKLDLAQAPGSETGLLSYAVRNITGCTSTDLRDQLELWLEAYAAQGRGVDTDWILDGQSVDDLRRATR
jgi:hypothetical protein